MWRIIQTLNRAFRQKFAFQFNNVRSSVSQEIGESTCDHRPESSTNDAGCISRFQEYYKRSKQTDEKINLKFFDCCLKSLEVIGVSTAIVLTWQLHKLSKLYECDVDNCKSFVKNQFYLNFLKSSSALYVLPQTHEPPPSIEDQVSLDLESAVKKFEESLNLCVGSIQNSNGVKFALSNEQKIAFHHFLTAAQLGCPKALFNLAVCYEQGFGTKQDFNKAAEYYFLAAEKDHAAAVYNIAIYYAQGKGGLKKNLDRAKMYFQAAASKGIKEAQTYIGVDCLQEGNWEQGLKLLESAADQEDHDAEFYLGVCYENALGTNENPVRAAHYYSKAAIAGHPGAVYNLAVFHEHGLGGLQADPFYAIELYKKIADKDSDAAFNLKRLQDLFSQKPFEEFTTEDSQLDLYPNSSRLHDFTNVKQTIASSSSAPLLALNEKKYKKATLWSSFLNLILPTENDSALSGTDTTSDSDFSSSPSSCLSPTSRDLSYFSSDSCLIKSHHSSEKEISSLDFLDLMSPSSSQSSPPHFSIGGEESLKEDSSDSGYLDAFNFRKSDRSHLQMLSSF